MTTGDDLAVDLDRSDLSRGALSLLAACMAANAADAAAVENALRAYDERRIRELEDAIREARWLLSRGTPGWDVPAARNVLNSVWMPKDPRGPSWD